MYDVEQRRLATDVTVGDFCRYLLEHVPADAVFHVGGVSQFYLHISKDGKAVSVDDSDLSCEDDYEGYDDYPIRSMDKLHNRQSKCCCRSVV